MLKAEEVMAMNMRVLQKDPKLKNTEKILRTIKFVVLARYDEEGKHWNYLKIKGPMFLVVDRFGKHRLAIMNHCGVDNEVIILHPGMKTEVCRLGNGEGYLLNYMIEDTLRRSIFGIWSADEQLEALHKDIATIVQT